MKNILKAIAASRYFDLFCRLAVGGLFIYAGLVKIIEPLDFAQNIMGYRLVGRTLAFAAALYLPWLELMAGVFLVAGFMKRASAVVISVLLVFFLALTVVTMARGIDVECGCFGALSRKADYRLLVEDGLLLLLSLAVLFAPTGAGRCGRTPRLRRRFPVRPS